MTVLEQAAGRGEARPDVSSRVASVPIDLVRHELILTAHPPSQDTIEEIVDEVFLPLVLAPGDRPRARHAPISS